MPIIDGSMNFDLLHEDKDWPKNGRSYKFGPTGNLQGTSATVIKDEHGIIHASLEMYQGATVIWETTLPPQPKINPYAAFFRWNAKEAICSISGKRLPTKPSAKA
jgi:hypothetical protein